MKKALILALIAGLMMGATVTADAKKKKPKNMKYFLHFPAEGSTCGARYMDLKDTPDSGCGFTLQPLNEVLIPAGNGLVGEWPASGGFPFKLDASKPVTAEFQLKNFAGQAAQGHAIFDLDVSATVGGKSVTLVDETVEQTMAAPGSNVITFSVKPPKNLNGKKVTSLMATTIVHGVTTTHYFELDNNGAYISIPAK